MTCLHYWISWSEHQGMTWLNYIIYTSQNKHRGTIRKIYKWIHSKVTNTLTTTKTKFNQYTGGGKCGIFSTCNSERETCLMTWSNFEELQLLIWSKITRLKLTWGGWLQRRNASIIRVFPRFNSISNINMRSLLNSIGLSFFCTRNFMTFKKR